MKKYSFKSWHSLLGVMVLVAFVGCGGSSGSSTSQSSTSTASSGTQTVSAEDVTPGPGMSAWQPFSSRVTLQIPVYDRGVQGVPAIGENYWEDWIQENFGDRYNITVEFVPITRSDVLTSYSLLAAAQDLPTILMEYDFPKTAQWANDGYLTTYDLQEFANIAPTYYQTMVDNNLLTYSELNGDRYFVLAERPYYDTNYTFVSYYRQDWLTQVGYDSYPTTWAEEKEMLQAIIDAGICEHPLGGQMVTGAGVDQNYAFRTYPLDEEDWAVYGDYAIPALGNEANKKFLRRENEKYNLGFTDPEYFIIDTETAKANFVNGEAISYSGYISANVDFLNSFYATNPDADLRVNIQSTTPDPEGGTVPAFRANNPFGMMIGFSSMASADEIRAAMMYLEWMIQPDNLYTLQWGFEGDTYNTGSDGLPVSVNYNDYNGTHKQGYNNNKDYWCAVIESRDIGTIEDMIRTNSPQGLPKDFSQEIIDNYYAQKECADNGYAVSDCNFGVVIDSASEYQASLLSLYTEYRDRLTMCSPDEFDALYDQLAQEYADAGYSEIADERREAYEAGYSTHLSN